MVSPPGSLRTRALPTLCTTTTARAVTSVGSGLGVSLTARSGVAVSVSVAPKVGVTRLVGRAVGARVGVLGTAVWVAVGGTEVGNGVGVRRKAEIHAAGP